MSAYLSRLIVLLGLFLASATAAQAAPMLRFWRGFIKPGISEKVFMDGLNQTFIPWTASLGTGRSGMVGYLPVIPSASAVVGGPDEFALVVYESEDKYKAFRATSEGKSYSDSHWDYFDKERSKSAVAQPFSRAIAFGGAYLVANHTRRWDVGYARFTMVKRADGLTDDQFLSNVAAWLRDVNDEGVDQDDRGHLGRVALVEKDFVATYDLWSDEGAYIERNDGNMDAPEDFGEYYVGRYGVGTVVQDLALMPGLKALSRGQGRMAPIAP